MSPGCRVLAFGDALSVTFQGDLLHFPILTAQRGPSPAPPAPSACFLTHSKSFFPQAPLFPCGSPSAEGRAASPGAACPSRAPSPSTGGAAGGGTSLWDLDSTDYHPWWAVQMMNWLTSKGVCSQLQQARTLPRISIQQPP